MMSYGFALSTTGRVASFTSAAQPSRPRTIDGLRSGRTGVRACAPTPAFSSSWGASLLALAATGAGS